MYYAKQRNLRMYTFCSSTLSCHRAADLKYSTNPAKCWIRTGHYSNTVMFGCYTVRK